MTTLGTILQAIGFSPRPQQTALYEQLLGASTRGVVAQAGTGTGKSIGVLAAAADWNDRTAMPTLVVTPTNVLMDQYLNVDAPRVQAAIGVKIRALKGRNRYLCSDAPAFTDITQMPDHVARQMPAMSAALHGEVIFEPRDTQYFGCPGSDGHTSEEDGGTCHYRWAKEEAQQADIIVTNTHLLIIDNQMKSNPDFEGGIFPELGAVLVDECHALEDSLREFATRSIPASSVEGFQLAQLLNAWGHQAKEATTLTPNGELVGALIEIRDAELDPKEKGYKRLQEAKEAAKYILDRGLAGAYSSRNAVLYLDPAARGTRQAHKLVSTQIDLAGAAGRILTSQPFGMVSATVPKSLRDALGVPQADFVDVGHPFDYRRQARMGISSWSGAWKAVQANRQNPYERISEIKERVLAAGGGALLLFASYKDMQMAHDAMARDLEHAGLKVLLQERDSDKMALGEQFKAHGNAVLFGTESFATGFDAPGDALRLVSIWKLPYPGLDPVTRAISERSRVRYEDLMLTKVTQAIGRLIRTTNDTGEIWIADSRAHTALLGRDDPMLAHLNEFQLVTAAAADDSY